MIAKRAVFAASIALVSFIFIYSVAAAGAPTIIIGTASGQAGSSVVLPVNFASGTTDVSALQFDITLPTGISYVSIATGTVAIAANKDVMAAAISGGMRVLVAGLNQTPIGTGLLANITLNASNTIPLGQYTLAPINIVFSDPNAIEVVSSSQSGSITVTTASSPSSADTTPPTISIILPLPGTTVSSSVTVTGTAADNVAVAAVGLSIDGGSYQPANGTSSWSYVIPSLNPGSHT
ncbi:MAG: hypothetical protein KGJ13_01750, partial [Patescibacteria group bacterium]|nr:hypothetical protein [Patescibacteria group bacterium]